MPHYEGTIPYRIEVPGATPEELIAHQAEGNAWMEANAAKYLELVTKEANEHAAKHGHKPMTITLAK